MCYYLNMSDSDLDNSPEDQPTVPPRPQESSVAEQPTFVPREDGDRQPSLPVPQLDDYEILDELGRGGMGVVYKARDTKLDRTVALKMIIGGKFASADEIQRFRIEGEAAARLDHPGIVPIYEIGEAEGNHFFSMKFIDGAALVDKLEDYRSDNRAAADLMIKIADAVQHAHQRGVLHRDLKPANVLIDANGDPSVTDLGLAKRMDGDSELTQTGLIMGTPGFMAPEQAAGRKDITTAADVFSLGAILYWLIAGKAPFTGETAVQTVMNTIEGEVPSLRLSVPEANSDLDLICQKAMHKDPLKRYSSAGALAYDLRAWLDGDLLSVRAPTALSLASVWVRKNLRTVLAACITGAACGLAVGGILAISELRRAAQLEHQVQELGAASVSWVNNFIWLRKMGNFWEIIQFMIVPAVAVCGFLCVLLVRPQTREANIVAAVTCGLAAGILTFLTGGSWGIMRTYALQPADADIEVLSTAVWLESETERKLAQRALIQRYPGLVDMDVATRQQRIRGKIMQDQRTGLLPGMWMGVAVSTLFTSIPLMFTCILSGMLWQQGMRGGMWFGCTWERCAYCLVFFLAMSFWLRDIKASPVIMLASLASIAFALFLAVKQAQWYWRVLVIPVPFIAMIMINRDIEGMRYSVNRAGYATTDDDFRNHMEQSNRFLVQAEHRYQRYATSIAWLYLGDEQQYRHHCGKLLTSFENAYRPDIASQLAKACLLRPDLQDPSDFATVYELTEFASAFESDPNIRWFYATRALAEVRRGNPADALDWNLRCRADAKVANGYMIAFSHGVDALAYLDLGDLEKARDSLAAGRSLLARTREEAMEDNHDGGWVDFLVFQIIEKEAEARLG